MLTEVKRYSSCAINECADMREDLRGEYLDKDEVLAFLRSFSDKLESNGSGFADALELMIRER